MPKRRPRGKVARRIFPMQSRAGLGAKARGLSGRALFILSSAFSEASLMKRAPKPLLKLNTCSDSTCRCGRRAASKKPLTLGIRVKTDQYAFNLRPNNLRRLCTKLGYHIFAMTWFETCCALFVGMIVPVSLTVWFFVAGHHSSNQHCCDAPQQEQRTF